MRCTLTFHGACDTVTGSRHLLTSGDRRLLVDCGLFQGIREVRERNWQRFPVAPRELDAVVLTHAHLDHSGYLPRLVAQGYAGPIYATAGTVALLRLLLPDSARLQEEEADHANRHGWSRHRPALPLYNQEEAQRALRQLEPLPYEADFHPLPELCTRFVRAGHILGSAFVLAHTDRGLVCFGGDLGRYGQSIIPDPTPVARADYLLLESTYGDRDHAAVDVAGELRRIVERAVRQRGWVLIPAFAIGRAQEVLYLLRKLMLAGELPGIPVYLDSPMAASAVPLFCQHAEDHDLEMQELMDAGTCPLEWSGVHYVQTREDSRRLNGAPGPGIIIAGSGMANGGRIRHHLLDKLPDARTTVLFVGYQAVGTPGRALLDGAAEFRAYGWEVPVRARVERVDGLSAHADRGEILRWLAGFESPPTRTFLVHGEAAARAALAARIRSQLHWEVSEPAWNESFVLGDGQ